MYFLSGGMDRVLIDLLSCVSRQFSVVFCTNVNTKAILSIMSVVSNSSASCWGGRVVELDRLVTQDVLDRQKFATKHGSVGWCLSSSSCGHKGTKQTAVVG